MATYDTIIKGGTIIDGRKSARFVSDIGIRDGRIACIGPMAQSSAARVIDAQGLIVAPGFIDLHTHYDSQIFWDPWCSISSWHGVTSVAIGNCGFGFAPCRPEDRERAMLAMSRNEAVPLETMQAGMPWDWKSFPEFLDSIERTPKGVNVLSYQPLAPLFQNVMGIDAAKSRRPTPSEMAEMCRLLEEAMEAGACGMSTQMLGAGSHQRDYDGTPMVTDEMSEADLVTLAGVLGKLGRGFVQGLGGTHELWEEVARVSGQPVIYNVITVTTDQHGVAMGYFRDELDWINQANGRGRAIFAQTQTVEVALEFTMADWNLFDFSPLWREATLGSREERRAKLSHPATRKALKDEFDDGFVMALIGVEGIPGIRIHAVASDALRSRDYEGRTVGEVAERDGQHPIDAFLDLTLADDLNTLFGTAERKTDLEAMREVVTNPYSIPGISDGGAHTKFMTFGSYPTDYLTDLVRDAGLLSLEDAHWHLSTLPAMAAGFRDRGWIAQGMPADLLVYDYENLRLLPSSVAHDYPANQWRRVRRAQGYRWILVNGEVTFEDGTCTGSTPGKLLRHGSA